MILWIVLTALVAVVSVLLAIPFVRRMDRSTKRDGQALAVARDQMAELEREVSAGLIGETEAKQARMEIERRIIAAAREPESAPREDSDPIRLLAVVSVVGLVAIGGAILYPVIGRPDLPSVPFSGAQNMSLSGASAQSGQTAVAPVASENVPGNVQELIADLAARLKQNPGDAEGWRMLGWSYFNTEEYGLASEAYAKAVALDGSDPNVLSAYGETLVRADEGLVSERALAVFEDALVLDPSDPRARFFKGMYLEQSGDPEAAIVIWQDILDTAPAGAEWTAGLAQRIQELADAQNMDVAALPNQVLLPPQTSNSAAPGPTAQDIQAAQEMTPEDRQNMIRSMVEGLASRLAENPNDPEGWIRLIRSRLVLGEKDVAQASYRKAQEVFASDPITLSQLQTAVREMGLEIE